MKSKIVLVLSLISCFCSVFFFESISFSKDKKELEIFVKGKKFDSFHSYKLIILKQKVLESIPREKEGHIKEFIGNLSDILSYEKTREFSEKDLKDLFKEVYNSLGNDEIERPKGDELEDMQEMLEDYNKSGSYVIDPDKVKTIIIDSSSKKKSRKKR